MTSPHVLCVDGYNFIHRSRAIDLKGDHVVTFSFFRSLRALIEKLKATRVYLAVEGVPVQRLAQFPEYKANRDRPELLLESGEAAVDEERLSFIRQKDEILRVLAAYFPVTLLRHQGYECDDVISNMLVRSSASVPWTVVSNDTDFIQLLNRHSHVKVYDPMRGGRYQPTPTYDYVSLKSLTGDGSDNIPGIKGVGAKTAEKMLQDPVLMEKKCLSDPDNRALFERNKQLIRFHEWSENDWLGLETATGRRDWDAVKVLFTQWGFGSIVSDASWKKFVSTFDALWGTDEGA